MMGKTHKYFNILLILVAIKLGLSFTSEIAAIFLGFYLLGTYVITPDVDLRLPVVKHRGITHRLSGMCLAGFAIILVSVLIFQSVTPEGIAAGMGFAISWLCHRVGDELSNEALGVKHDWLLKTIVVIALIVLVADIVSSIIGVNLGDEFGKLGESIGIGY